MPDVFKGHGKNATRAITMSHSGSMLVSGLTIAGLVASGALIFNKEGQPLQASVGFALVAFICTILLIPLLKNAFVKAGFSGKDLSKPKQPVMCVFPLQC